MPVIIKENMMTRPTVRKLCMKLYMIVKNSFKLQPMKKLGGPGGYVDVDESMFIRRKVRKFQNQ